MSPVHDSDDVLFASIAAGFVSPSKTMDKSESLRIFMMWTAAIYLFQCSFVCLFELNLKIR
jgi:hypothetical protein